MLKVHNLAAGYRDTRIIQEVQFSVAAGDKVAILGRNGVGKTTLLATLMGITDRTSGVIWVDGKDVTHAKTSARARAGLGYVPQTRDIFPSLTVNDNLRIGLACGGGKTLADAYALFPRLRERQRNYAGQLSGGEQQMLSIARTLLGNPSILLLDEPLEGLAPVICDELMASLVALADGSEIAVLLVEQKIERALDFADRVLILERGTIAWSGTAKELKRRHDIVERYIGVSGFH
jgi:branched-chain amino acid transport system ATP-binding protein